MTLFLSLNVKISQKTQQNSIGRKFEAKLCLRCQALFPTGLQSGSKIISTKNIHKNIFSPKSAEKQKYSTWAGKQFFYTYI